MKTSEDNILCLFFTIHTCVHPNFTTFPKITQIHYYRSILLTNDIPEVQKHERKSIEGQLGLYIIQKGSCIVD